MDLDPKQILVQLGIAGLLVVVFYRVAVLLIANWREAEKERTAAIAAGFSSVTASISVHHHADVAGHERMADGLGEVQQAVVRVEAKLDTLADLTPVRGITAPRRQTPPEGVPGATYNMTRPKTGGR